MNVTEQQRNSAEMDLVLSVEQARVEYGTATPEVGRVDRTLVTRIGRT